MIHLREFAVVVLEYSDTSLLSSVPEGLWARLSLAQVRHSDLVSLKKKRYDAIVIICEDKISQPATERPSSLDDLTS